MAYFPLKEQNQYAKEMICEDLVLGRESCSEYKEWKHLPRTKRFSQEEKEYMVIRFTLHEHLGGLFYARSLVDSIQEFYLQAFDGERLVHTSIIGPEDFLVPLKPKIFDSGISAHTEYAKIRSQAIKERRRFVDFFNYFLLTL